MIPASDTARRLELGEYIRAQRARLTPGMVGIDGGSRRRTPGLRREEVAQLCGLSTTWYTWLEQGRDISLSSHALSRLATVLRLTGAARDYVFDLAGKRDPQASAAAGSNVPPALLAALPLIGCPAYVLDHLWTAEAWNDAARHLFSGWLDAGEDHNLLRFIFLDPRSQSLIVDWPVRARRVLAEFRADYSRHLDEPAMQELVAGLSARSPVFAAGWEEHSVVGREGGARSFSHPTDGALHFRQITLNPFNRADLKLVMLTPDA